MTNLCNVNGKIVREEDARVPVLDRGFLFGDSIYEVIRTLDGVPFAWPEHLQRLHDSAAGLELEIDVSDRELTRRIVDTIAASGNADSYVRIIVTRGPGSAPNIDVTYATGGSTCVVMVRDLPAGMDAPATLAIVPRLRTDRRALDPAIKSGNYLNNVMGLKEARARGASECLFMNNDGNVTEASTSNVWFAKGGTVVTPPLSAGLLAGVTRRLLIDMCRADGIPVEERDVQAKDLRSADGIFLTSTLRGIAPVTALDGEQLLACAQVEDLRVRFSKHCLERSIEVDKPALAGLLGE